MLRLLVVLFLCCVPIHVQSQTLNGRASERFYGAAFLGWQTVNVNDASFDARMANVAAGVWLWEGIGLEGEIGASYTDDTISGLRLDVPTQVMLNLRLESPPTDGYAAYVQLGLTHTEIDSRFTASAAGSSITSSLSGVHLGIGMLLHINRWLAADAGFSRLIYEDDSDVNLFRFGLRITPGRL